MNELLPVKPKLNIKRVIITIIYLIIIVFLIVIINIKLKQRELRKSTIEYANALSEMQNEEEQKEEQEEAKRAEQEKIQQEQAKLAEGTNQKKYQPLTADDIEKLKNIYKHSDTKRVFLTFDDGPSTAVTPFILDLLKKENIKANFFVVGNRANKNQDLIRREYNEGHFIGNHSYTHEYSTIYSSPENVLNEYNQTNNLLKNIIGNQNFNTLLFRFPGGLAGGKYAELKQNAANLLYQNGIGNVDWNALTNDAEGAKTKEKIMSNFYETIKNKTSIVLLMHDSSNKILTYETLPDIIKYFRDNGYEFQTIYQYLGRE